MNKVSTLSELLTLSNTKFRIYDVGRKIDKIDKVTFSKIELNQIPYPYPIQNHAMIAIAFWQKMPSTPYLWFIKLPLDERGLLNQGARDHFIAIIIEALGSDLTVDPSEHQEELLKSNPYHFTPSQYKLAALNSKINASLKQKPSEYLPLAQAYLAGDLGWENWQNIGVQGITDFATKINDKGNSQLLINALPNVKTQVLEPLCTALENEELQHSLIDSFIDLLSLQLLNLEQIDTHLLRALASSCHLKQVNAFAKTLLQQAKLSNEVLITLSGRCWTLFEDKKLLMAYLEQLVKEQDLTLFTAIFRDLVAIPTVRPILLQSIRDPNRSQGLSQAIGQLFNPQVDPKKSH